MTINKEFPIIESEINVFDSVLKILVFLSTLVCLPDRGLFVFEQIWFHISVIILALTAFTSEKQRDFNPALLIGFNTVFILNVFTHNFNSLVMQYALNVFILSLAVFLVASYTQNWRSVIKWIFASYVVTSVVLVFQLYGYNVLQTSLGENSGGLMGNLPRLSFLACLVLPMAFKSRAKFLLIPMIMLSCGYVSPQYCIFAVFLMCFWFRCGSYGIKSVIALSIASILIYVYMTKPVSINLRIEYYFLIIRDFFSVYWLSGFGAGIPFAKDIGARDMQTYSSILQFVFTTGIAGIIWLCFACIKFFKSFRASALNLSILAFVMISIWEYPFEVRRLWFLLAVLIGFLIIENKENQRS